MLIDIDPDSESPLYQQLRDQVVQGIADGSLTVGKGYELLRQEGLVRTNRRSGTVVARGPAEPQTPGFSAGWTDRLRTLLAEAVAHGMADPSIRTTTDSLLADFASHRTDPGRSAS